MVPDRTVADFYIRYPDAIYLAQVREFADNAAKAAALATGTKVKIDNYGQDRDGISVATLDELGFAYMKMYGATHVNPEPAKPQGYEETGSLSSAIPGVGFAAHTSDYANHTYEMEKDRAHRGGPPGLHCRCRGDDRPAIRFRQKLGLPRRGQTSNSRASRRYSGIPGGSAERYRTPTVPRAEVARTFVSVCSALAKADTIQKANAGSLAPTD